MEGILKLTMNNYWRFGKSIKYIISPFLPEVKEKIGKEKEVFHPSQTLTKTSSVRNIYLCGGKS